jgi:hypothetical protein
MQLSEKKRKSQCNEHICALVAEITTEKGGLKNCIP